MHIKCSICCPHSQCKDAGSAALFAFEASEDESMIVDSSMASADRYSPIYKYD